MRKTILILLLIAPMMLVGRAYAIDLMGIYKQALSGDPTFQEARAKWMSDRENIAISRSGLLPQLGFGADVQAVRTDNIGNTFSGNTIQQYSLTVTQPIFNLQVWKNLSSAKAVVKASFAGYSASYQDLLFRITRAYFSVLEAEEVLRFTNAKKKAIALQLNIIKQRLRVGMAIMADLHQAQANYDFTRAQQIKAVNDLANMKEALSEITGKHYKTFSSLKKLLLVSPKPDDIARWVKTALRQNYSLLSSNYNVDAKHENMKAKRAGNFPTVNLQGGGSYMKSVRPTITSVGGAGGFGNLVREASVGVSVDFPLVQGGLVGAETRQAIHQYEMARANFNKVRRHVISKTRQDYLGVNSTISKVEADMQAVKSAKTSLSSTKAGYDVGTQMMIDVLDAQTKLYEARVQLARDKYDYILKVFALKFDAGTLDESDVFVVNKWLVKKVSKKRPKKKLEKLKRRPEKKIAPKAKQKNLKIKKSNLSGTKKELLLKNPNHYTLQLMADQRKKRLIDYADKNMVTKNPYIYRVKVNGEVWYKLISGDYATRKEAELAASKYSIKPWIRKYRSIQNDFCS